MSDEPPLDQFAVNSRRLAGAMRLVACVGFTGLVAMSLLTMGDAIGRWLTLPRIPGFSDIGEVVYPIVIASCFPALLIRDQNITIRFLGKAIGTRGNNFLEAFGHLVVLVFFALLVWQFYFLTLDYMENTRVSPTLEFPIAPWWWITSVIITLTVPVQAWVFFDSVHSLIFSAPSRIPKEEAEGV